VRAALGATPGSVQRYILYRSGRRALAASVLGLPLTVAVTAAARESLGGVALFDVHLYGTFTLALTAAAMLGALGPAREGAGLHPAELLAEE
jgi:ABC-type lipoprotein release transport system permease subunit